MTSPPASAQGIVLTWSSPASIESGGFQSVSCASSSFCVAADGTGNAYFYGGSGLASVATSWTESSPDPGNAIRSVSCPASSPPFCAAVDSVGNALTWGGPGTNWVTQNIDGTTNIRSVSCSSASFCMAIDGNGDAFTWGSGSWTYAGQLDTVSGPTSLSCPTSSFCMAVDGSAGDALNFTYTGGSTPWTTTVTPLQGSFNGGSISCSSSSFCVAASQVGGNSVTYASASGTYEPVDWSAPNPVDGDLFADSCVPMASADAAAPGFCVAVSGGGYTSGSAWIYQDDTWSQTNDQIDSVGIPVSMSCPSSSFCASVDDYGHVIIGEDDQVLSSTTTTPTNPSVALGTNNTDVATVTGNASSGPPTGTVQFYACGPSSSAGCTSQADPVGAPVSLVPGTDLTSTATSPSFDAPEPGDWCFAGYYSGDANYFPSSDASADECFSVTNAAVGSLSGTVTDTAGNLIGGAEVSICSAESSTPNCYVTVTGAAGSPTEGQYDFPDITPDSYSATVFPPSGSLYNEYTTTSPFPVSAGNQNPPQDFVLTTPVPLPDGTTITGVGETNVGGLLVPVIYWMDTTTVTTHACSGGTVTATITGVNSQTGTAETIPAPPKVLMESAPGSGTYTGQLPAPYPIHGDAAITITVTGCSDSSQDGSIGFTVYIDPSGTVVNGADDDAPVSGASVTLLSSDSIGGPFTPVADGSAVMSPGNRTNPDVTAANGTFGWDVIPGYYEIQATKVGCGTDTTPAFTVPPEIENLQIVLDCPPPTITGLNPTCGSPGTKVVISGANLSGATDVSFRGFGFGNWFSPWRVDAEIDQDSATQITVTVPYGATTGEIEVTTSGGEAESSTFFVVSCQRWCFPVPPFIRNNWWPTSYSWPVSAV